MSLYSQQPSFWFDRIRASSVHLICSLIAAAIFALFVLGFWYSYPYRELSGGRELFLTIVTVDVILGPLITLAVFNRTKPTKELRRDLLTVALIQFVALCYGAWVAYIARPVHMVFEIDRFRVVHAIEVDEKLLSRAPKGIQSLPVSGPTTLALRPFKDDDEKLAATMAALQGVSLASRPDLWRPYEEATGDILRAAKPATQLLIRFAPQAASIRSVLAKVNRTPENVVYLPLVGRKSFWTVFLDPVTAQILITMPLDSF